MLGEELRQLVETFNTLKEEAFRHLRFMLAGLIKKLNNYQYRCINFTRVLNYWQVLVESRSRVDISTNTGYSIKWNDNSVGRVKV